MMRYGLIALLLAFVMPASAVERNLEKLYLQIDDAISRSPEYVMAYENKIKEAKDAYVREWSSEKKLEHIMRIFDLYKAYDNDSALAYIQYYIDDEIMLFESGNVLVYSKWSNDVDEFPVDALSEFMQTGFKSVCKVNKNNFIALLERIVLFVGKYDKEVIRLYFEKDGIRVSNKDRSSNELIEYVESKKFKVYDCAININMLLTQLKAYAGDIVEIHYNNDKAIKLVGEKTSQIIALVVEK